MTKSTEVKSVAERLTAAQDKAKLIEQKSRLAIAKVAKLELEEAQQQLIKDRDQLRQQIAVGKMILSWVHDASEDMSAEELKSKLEEYLTLDGEVIDATPLDRQLDSIMGDSND